MKKIKPPFPGATKTLVLAHRQELLEQTRNHVLRTGTALTVSIDQGKRVADMSADVIVASVASLGRAGTPRLLKYDPKEFKCIIIDEAHHAAAESYGRILTHFGADVPETHLFVFGCSATVRRHDGMKLGGAFDHISYHKSFINMIEEKWLCGLRVSTIKTDFDLRDVKMLGEDFSPKELAIRINTPVRNDVIARSYMTYCKDRKSTVVFAVDIEHLETLTRVFREYGYDARALSSNTDDGERAKMLREFREQMFPIIVNCGILTEGTDIPTIDSIIMARPTKSNVLFLQMLGRGMRLYHCLVLDFVDVVKGEGLVTVPTLLGLDASSVMNKVATINSQEDIDTVLKDEIETIEQDSNLAEYPDETETVETIDPLTKLKVARIRLLEYENPYQLLEDGSGMPQRVWNMSPNAWVNIGPNAFALSLKNLTFRVEKSPEDGLYRCLRRSKLMDDGTDDEDGFGQFMSKGTMLPIESDTLTLDTTHTSLDDMLSKLGFVQKADYDMEEGGDDDDDGTAQWQQKQQQQRQRQSRRKPLTKGQAANMITRLLHGAGQWWEASKKFKIKRAKQLAKEIGVDVGPIPKHLCI
ncbi:hypothetical protein BGZ65_007837 [Modicella reniformis]|uniref:P-loop containing nucleoside triphosphate hydrolase protein n=1 Tax=Modicella reniformis TaxID=1440133 RepID=A0A9P6MFA4_9FUNG|nr:hypothetical protein BGZ65_007837 [Modicella reniformis]